MSIISSASLLEKEKLRKHMHKKRQCISKAQQHNFSSKIVFHFMNSLLYKQVYKQVGKQNNFGICSYLTMKKEADVGLLLTRIIRDNAKVFIPLPDIRPFLMRQLCVGQFSKTCLYITQSGKTTKIPVPFSSKKTTDIQVIPYLLKHNFDAMIVLVPGLAFSSTGKRLGRGGGYYDRLIAKLRCLAHLYIVGVCYEYQLCEDDHIPMQSHDEYMDYILTESGLFKCERYSSRDLEI